MKIVGGSFGVDGKAFIDKTEQLVVHGAKQRSFAGAEIASVETRIDKQKKFGVVGFVIGAILLAAILGAFLSMLGVVLGIAFAAAGSFYSSKTNLAEIRFTSGDSVSLQCTPAQLKSLVQLKG